LRQETFFDDASKIQVDSSLPSEEGRVENGVRKREAENRDVEKFVE